MKDPPHESIDVVGELVANTRPGLRVEVELAGCHRVGSADVVAEALPGRSGHHVVQPFLDLALPESFSVIRLDVTQVWGWRGAGTRRPGWRGRPWRLWARPTAR
jgi:hypothetical protein